MRVNKFLAAVAIPATFAACTQEELFVAENAPVDMAMEEVVGYRTIGTDVTFSASSTGDETRMSATGNWEKTDQIGLGWLVYGNPQDEQTPTNKPTQSKLWANHQFVWNGEEFATQGNVYEGWYFAYYPWSYEKKAGVTKFVEVNPAQKSKVWKDRLSQNLHMSTLQFIGAKNMDDNNKITTPIQLRNAVNNLIVTSTPAKGSAFAEGGQLTDLAIESIKIGVDQDVFASWLTLYPRLLSTTEEDFNESLKNAMAAFKSDKTTSGRENTITTNVAEAGFVTGETANMVTIVAPYAPTTALDATKVSIEINVAGGSKFVIAYTPDAETGTTAAKNNAALVTLAEELSAGGKLTAPQTSTNPYAMVNVELNDANFQPNFDNISDIDQWIAAVELADKLDRKDLVFTVTDNIEFTAEKGIEDGTLVAPVNGVSVIAKAGAPKLVIKGETSWNQNIKSVDVVGITVDANGVLDVDGLVAASSFVNNGIINASKNATLATHGAGFINNGRVNVEYGAEVRITDLAACATGHIIAYEVEEDNKAEYTKIKNLTTLPALSPANKKYAYVNTLVFDNNFNLKLNGTSPSTEEDPYFDVNTPAGDDAVVGNGLNIEATGAIVEGPADIKVKNVTLTNATLKGVEIEGTVSATGSVINTTKAITGAVTATDSEIAASAINGDVTAAETTINVPTITGGVSATDCTIYGAKITGDVENKGTTTLEGVSIMSTLTNDGTITINGNDDIVIKKIVNNATLTANTTVNVEEIELKKGVAKTTVQEDPEKVIYFSKNYVQGGTTTGKILPSTIAVNGDTFEISDVDGLKAFAAMANNGNTFVGKTIKLTADIDLNNIAWTPIAVFTGTFNGNGKTISNLNVTAEKAAGFFANLYKGTIINLTIDGAKVMGSHHVGAIAGGSYGTINGCTVKNAVISCVNPADGEDGDKAGAVIGYHAKDQAAQILNCTVLDSKVDAGRDAGQVVGAAKAENVVNCSAENTTVAVNGTATGVNILNEVVGRKL